jgi:hypothetical protein
VSVVRALLDELSSADLADLASQLQPYLTVDDSWLNTREAASYAGCSIHALRHAARAGEVKFQQACPGGKTWFRRSEIDRWRESLGSGR